MPTQRHSSGITYDFNLGARISLPPRTDGKWRIHLTDLDTGNLLFESDNAGAFVCSSKRYFVRFGVQIWNVENSGQVTEILTHHYDARGREILIQFPVGTLGDTLAWFPSAARFAEVHGCMLTCAMSERIIPLLEAAYPQIRFVTPAQVLEQGLEGSAYATYNLGLFFDDAANVHQPTDFRLVGLHRTAAYILNVPPSEAPPHLTLPDESRPIQEPYVCIGVQATTQCKKWNNHNGWREVIAFLKSRGYRVICVDQYPVGGAGIVYTHLPHGAEDGTGDLPLVDRARWLRHATAFIGLASGLSWLAWASRCPVVMISGFSHPTTEFSNPHRVINWHTCNSCWNDTKERFDHHDYLWCPRHAGTPRQFECTRLITSQQVCRVIEAIPNFNKRPN